MSVGGASHKVGMRDECGEVCCSVFRQGSRHDPSFGGKRPGSTMDLKIYRMRSNQGYATSKLPMGFSNNWLINQMGSS